MEHPLQDYLQLRVDAEAMPFPIAGIKTLLADAINAAIDTIAKSCVTAEIGFIYLDHPQGRPTTPRDVDLARLHRHGITATGTVPMFSNAPQ